MAQISGSSMSARGSLSQVERSKICEGSTLVRGTSTSEATTALPASITQCADSTQPGVDAVRDYLASLPYAPKPNCDKGHFYMVNNNSPAFLPDGH